MKPQALISAGFAITALASASVPAVGWTLPGDVVIDPPTVTVQAPSTASLPLYLAEVSLPAIAVERALPETSIQAVDRNTPW